MKKYTIWLLAIIFVLVSKGYSQDNQTCYDCHDDPEITMEKKGKEISLTVRKFDLKRSAHQGLKCVECHKGFNPDDIPHKEKITPVNCMDCHKDYKEKHTFHTQFKNAAKFDSPDLNCKSCHGTHNVVSPKNPSAPMHFTKSTEFCGKCHTDVKKHHLESQHFVQLQKHDPNAPTCIYCHKNPVTLKSEGNKLKLKQNQEKLCLNCHLKTNQTKYSKSLIDYEKSVHGQAILKGNEFAAACIDCHGTHELKKASDTSSSVAANKIPDVCGKCHITISQEYKASIHGQSLMKGNADSPGCTYCHGEHAIQTPLKIDKQLIQKNKMNFENLESTKMLQCVECHANEDMMKKYNVLTIEKAHDWLPNLATHYQTVRCVDCHSVYEPPHMSHNILNPEQTIKRCEECHSKNSVLMSMLYKHEKEKSREKLGFINGTVLSDAYVVGTTRNVFLDVLSLSVFGLVIFGIAIHGAIRWYFKKSAPKDDEKIQEIKEDLTNN